MCTVAITCTNYYKLHHDQISFIPMHVQQYVMCNITKIRKLNIFYQILIHALWCMDLFPPNFFN
eukprot:UN09096